MTTTNVEAALEETIAKTVVQLHKANQLLGLFADGVCDLLDCGACDLGLEIDQYREIIPENCSVEFAFLLLDEFKRYVNSNPKSDALCTTYFNLDNWQLPDSKDIGGENANRPSESDSRCTVDPAVVANDPGEKASLQPRK
ncbi:hypothetical protein H0A36_29585 [Endozoicomonas sp. SM1973]|uniref:Uncharacterized protein n=1 Tax=Spartinivicinus marinus TaxID=2994442 RepID=A0A853II43_9GAMM|nr:hypothetical protein [Spartinivicinus marinus]MCX4027913.1 hypothetical protein [Spartinivicinus marinus]NYZ70168.1 hypothetical protein [Spartinivicinus marinus]